MRPRPRRAAAAAGLLAATLAGCGPAGEPSATVAQVDGLVARCAEAMARDVCTARADTRGAADAAASGPVFVAGSGAVDPQAYGEIRAAGDAMCQLVRRRCTEDWRSSACRTARSLWPAPVAPS